MEKTLSLVLIIGLGFLLQKKVTSPDQLKGIKVLILSLALPATIFAALLNVEVSNEMLLLPLIGLLINLVLFGSFYFGFKAIKKLEEDKKRTLLMLLPSLAPGLSCFPFIAEYLGSDALAMAALADVGNKVFVLILLYMLAMNWYYKRSELRASNAKNRLKELLISLGKEPINLVIVAAFILLAFGVNMSSLPSSISSVILRISTMMAPLVLLFIGMAVNIKKNDVWMILRMLSLRSGIAFLLCTLLTFFLPNLTTVTILLLFVFSQSSASFWPYAHIHLVNEMELKAKEKTFSGGLALSILALSLPFSTFMILGILSFPTIAISPIFSGIVGGSLIVISLLSPFFNKTKGLIRGLKDKELKVSR